MKKSIFLLVALIGLCLCSFAQIIQPRTWQGIKNNQDNTGKSFSYGYVSVTGTSVTITGANLNYNHTTVYVNSSASATINGFNLRNGQLGDAVRVIFNTAAGTNLYTFQNLPLTATGFRFNTAGVVTVAGTKNATILLIHNGRNGYVESGRFIEP